MVDYTKVNGRLVKVNSPFSVGQKVQIEGGGQIYKIKRIDKDREGEPMYTIESIYSGDIQDILEGELIPA